MKKRLLFVREWRLWNRLLAKFGRLHKRLSAEFEPGAVKHLTAKLQQVYSSLERLQSRTGIRLAGTAVAVMLASGVAKAQEYRSQGEVTVLKASQEAINLPSSDKPAFGDIDGDGDIEMIVASSDMYNPAIRLFDVDAAGKYIEKGRLKADGSPIAIVYGKPTFADVDGDNDLDLYVGGSQKISVFKNDGAGNFTADGYLGTGAGDISFDTFHSLRFADLDKDGDLDLYVAFFKMENTYIQMPDGMGGYISMPMPMPVQKIRTFTNNGGSFTESGNLVANGAELTALFDFDFADLDKDNDLDLVTHNPSDGTLLEYPNDGNGTFGAPVNFTENSVVLSNPGMQFLEVFDADGDTHPDLFLNKSGNLTRYAGTAVAAQVEPGADVVAYLHTAISTSRSFQFVDLDGDDANELYITGNSNTIYRCAPIDQTTFMMDAEPLKVSGVAVTSNLCSSFADVDRDGDMDLYVVASVYNNETHSEELNVRMYANDGTGTLTGNGMLQSETANLNLRAYAKSICFGDLDNDGDQDLLESLYDAGSNFGKIRYYTNNGGKFTDAGFLKADGAEISKEYYNVYPAIGDIDQDGDVDVVIGTFYDYLKICTNDGTGTLTSDGNFVADGNEVFAFSTVQPSFADMTPGCGLDLFLNSYEGLMYYQWTDVTAPVLTCAGDQTIEVGAAATGYIVSGNELDPTAWDDECTAVTLTNSYNNKESLANAVLPLGTSNIEWVATDENGNKSTCSTEVTVNTTPTGVSSSVANEVAAVPNPTKGIVTLHASGDGAGSYTVGNIGGSTVASGQIVGGKATFDMSALPNGIYLIKVNANGGERVLKLVKK